MSPASHTTYKIILSIIGVFLLIMGMLLFFNPPGLFPDPALGFQVLRAMHLGSSFNVFNSPDQSDIAQNYDEFLTWWSPGQYLIPDFFQTLFHINTGKAIAIVVTLSQVCGLAGFYAFFKKIGFTPIVATLSIAFIICQQAFVVPYVYYNGGEVLLFAFEGWFLLGCVSINKPGFLLVLFILLSGWVGFFLKSSFVWIYAAGLCGLWIRLSAKQQPFSKWFWNAAWIGVPAIISIATIYFTYISKGQSPASAANGFNFTFQTLGFPLASPILSGFSIDDLLHGLFFHSGKPILPAGWSLCLLIFVALTTVIVIWLIVKKVPNENYRLFLLVFYCTAILFFGSSYLRQLTISMEARHYRILGILIFPGIIYLASKLKTQYVLLCSLIPLLLLIINFNYLIRGYQANKNGARGVTGVTQTNVDQQSLNQLMKLDNENRNATFVFISYDTGLEIFHNRIITLLPISDDLKIDIDDYRYLGHAGPLYIVLPESYNGPKEKMILKSFPGYKGFNVSMLSDNFVLYSAK
jgi:hypothetical protein